MLPRSQSQTPNTPVPVLPYTVRDGLKGLRRALHTRIELMPGVVEAENRLEEA